MTLTYRDSALYMRTAREAVQTEREGDYRQASKLWSKANRFSRNSLNQTWSAHRSDFCLMQIEREKFKKKKKKKR
ncbi:ANR family transcriptional regulator [Photorhabdus heterorhabditis]|uniref:ANR family transcriptional regulator n=1 Tax=Photorhabdus heterorhabditis TaxID=880156 RepID=UPI001562982A|nr:ANR family transcriptional regulator [Photorhabdus heterorhabditis]NRN27878.1 ANR family transcriptional regulator [Photorhabdus heterorhabditis subsp. aluminescens]